MSQSMRGSLHVSPLEAGLTTQSAELFILHPSLYSFAAGFLETGQKRAFLPLGESCIDRFSIKTCRSSCHFGIFSSNIVSLSSLALFGLSQLSLFWSFIGNIVQAHKPRNHPLFSKRIDCCCSLPMTHI